MVTPITPEMIEQAEEALRQHGTIAAAAASLGMKWSTFRDRLMGGRKGQARGALVDTRKRSRARGEGRRLQGQAELPLEPEATPATGRIWAPQREEWPVPGPGGVKRYIFTCAQNNTGLHVPTWENLQALASYYGASIHVSSFTYDASSYGDNVKRGTEKEKEEIWWAPEVVEHLLDSPVAVAPGLIWCGELNILPTAVRPLSGMESYTGRKSGIIPHVKFAMESVASGKHEPTKFNYTTGTVTLRNYIQKKAGQKAEFHHGYGGLLVEVDSAGDWWVRQLNADSEGTIYDLNIRATDGRVTSGHRVEAVQWGDIHRDRISPTMMELLWGKHSMMNDLSPKYQFAHDVLDFRPRNHHDLKNFHRMYEKFVSGNDDVLAELRRAAHFLQSESHRDWCQTIVVRSNHDAAFDRWLREADYKHDLKNARFFLEAQLAFVRAIDDGDKGFMPFEWACRRMGVPEDVKFLKQDESFVICKDANGGIECGHHGDKGANGAKGSLTGFSKSGRKINIGDKHSAGIMDGTYLAGVAGDLDHGYNEGMSSWSNSHTITYQNGKRCIVTVWNGKWKA